MEILTDVTLGKLLANCKKYENYVAAILFFEQGRKTEFLNEIKTLGNEWSVNARLGRMKCTKTNSHIYTFTITKNFEDRIRGMEFNSMLLDGDKEADEVLAYLYSQSLVKYMSTQNVEETTDKGSADKALTNFLDEFTITAQS